MTIKYYLHQGPIGAGRTVRIDATEDADARRRGANVMTHSGEEGELWKHYSSPAGEVTTIIAVYQPTAAPRLWAHAHATEDRAIVAEAAGGDGRELRRVALNLGEVALMAVNDGECYLVRSGVRNGR